MGDFLGTSTSESAYIPETKTDIGAGATFIIVGSCAYVAKKMLWLVRPQPCVRSLRALRFDLCPSI